MRNRSRSLTLSTLAVAFIAAPVTVLGCVSSGDNTAQDASDLSGGVRFKQRATGELRVSGEFADPVNLRRGSPCR